MAEKFEYDAFLSYNSKDKTKVRKLAERLLAAGARVWFDEWCIKAGDDIFLAVERGLQTARVQILCMSPAAFESGWVDMERSTVLFRDPTNVGRRFIPLLLAECDPPDTLRRYKYVDFRLESESAFRELLNNLGPTQGDKRDRVPHRRATTPDTPFAVDHYLRELDHCFAESQIADWYVPPACAVEQENGQAFSVNPDEWVDSWLQDKSRKCLAVLGDYGTGKSWFCLRLAKRLADRYRKDVDSNPIPLLISFKRFNPSLDLSDLVRLELFEGYGVQVRNPVGADFRGAEFGRPHSRKWSKTIKPLRDCRGYVNARFDEKVHLFLKK